jgi:polysaccharide pyruvyl transferase WcaK-like protein
MKTVSIIAATISGNRGAEAMLSTTIGEIRKRYPDCCFNAYTYYPQQDRALIKDSQVRIFSATPLCVLMVLFPFSILLALLKLLRLKPLYNILPKSIRAIDQSDVLIDLAGVSFIDGREKFLPYNILTLIPAFLLKTPVVKFSQALGPFEHPLNRFLAQQTLKHCSQIFARGESTYQYLQTLDLLNIYPTPVSDVAFLHQPEYALSEENPEKLRQLTDRLKDETRPLIGICPSSVLAAKEQKIEIGYTQSLTALCQNLANQGFALLLFPNATRASEAHRLRNNDLPVIKQISDQLSGRRGTTDGVYCVNFDINTGGIKQLMAYCKILLVSRFHAMIAALSAKQPVIVIGWSHKYQEVMESFGFMDMVFDFSQSSSDIIQQTVERSLNEYGPITKSIESKHASILISSRTQFNYIFELLESNNRDH